MKLHLLRFALIFGFITSPLVWAADTGLEKEMKDIKNAFNQLKQQVGDPSKNASALTLVGKMRAAAVNCRKLQPEKATELPEKDRAAFVGNYKDEMNTFIANIDKLEAALKAGDNADAAKIVADLKTIQRDAHKEFRTEKD